MECWCGRALPPGRQGHSDWYHTRLREQLARRLAAPGLELAGAPPSDALPDRQFIVAASLLLNPARDDPASSTLACRAHGAQWRAAQIAATGGAVVGYRRIPEEADH